jgi:hypothetical protein
MVLLTPNLPKSTQEPSLQPVGTVFLPELLAHVTYCGVCRFHVFKGLKRTNEIVSFERTRHVIGSYTDSNRSVAEGDMGILIGESL